MRTILLVGQVSVIIITVWLITKLIFKSNFIKSFIKLEDSEEVTDKPNTQEDKESKE